MNLMPALAFAAVLAAPFAAAADAPAPAAPPAYTAAQKAAAVAIDLEQRAHATFVTACATKVADPEAFRMIAMAWDAANLGVTLPAERILAGLPAAERRALEQAHGPARTRPAPDAGNCDATATSWLGAQAGYAATDAEPAAILLAVYAKDDRLRIARRNRDLTVGCMKQAYNSGVRAFDLVQEQCACHTRAIVAAGTDREIDAWLDDVAKVSDAEGAKTLERPWIRKAMQAAAACSK